VKLEKMRERMYVNRRNNQFYLDLINFQRFWRSWGQCWQCYI